MLMGLIPSVEGVKKKTDTFLRKTAFYQQTAIGLKLEHELSSRFCHLAFLADFGLTNLYSIIM